MKAIERLSVMASVLFLFSPLGVAAQELVLSGGLENWVKERL